MFSSSLMLCSRSKTQLTYLNDIKQTTLGSKDSTTGDVIKVKRMNKFTDKVYFTLGSQDSNDFFKLLKYFLEFYSPSIAILTNLLS